MRAPTAFFLFSEEQREQTRAECIAAAEPGAKISVATVAKAIGEKWRALSNLEKAAYQEKQIQRAAELAASAKADAEAKAGEGALDDEDAEKQADQSAEQDPSANPHPFGFPLSLVKRVMCMDSEVARISREGLQAVAKTAELLVADMAARSLAAAQGQKRRTIKLCDVSQTVRRDRRLVDVGLKDILAEDIFKEGKTPLRDADNRANTAAARQDGAEQAEQLPAAKKAGPGRKKAKESVEKAQPITSFFTK
ncbi:hypothetical protein CVIRNUC_006871 [Coccomyxa viridis]|uniref:HMG box domain-containing protein n=1 Tax=Coccomyxa viridis TaxID=1274662 RepID=A0AAV1IBS1_9CHLO|nr:hypothetical protein CVIRNUC_006871 [Coccomyxa viridis]